MTSLVTTPLIEVGQRQRDYVNYDQRNVHIWGSDRDEGTTPSTAFVYLIAGFYNDVQNKKRNLITWGLVYHWLEMFLKVPADADQKKPWLLIKWEHDPTDPATELPSDLEDEHWLDTYLATLEGAVNSIWPTADAPTPCAPGHYLLVVNLKQSKTETSGYAGGRATRYSTMLPVFLSNSGYVIDRSPPAGSTQTNTGTTSAVANRRLGTENKSRSAVTRNQVRLRDIWCIVTHVAGLLRDRGHDFTGLDVAHIFPLGSVGEKAPNLVMDGHHMFAQELLTSRKSADTPENAILLRSDIHHCFDAYHFAIYPESPPPQSKDGPRSEDAKAPIQPRYKIYTFEKTIPECLVQLDTLTLDLKPHPDGCAGNQRLSPEYTGVEPSNPSDWLFMEHFRMASLWHVAATGRPRHRK